MNKNKENEVVSRGEKVEASGATYLPLVVGAAGVGLVQAGRLVVVEPWGGVREGERAEGESRTER